MLSRAKTVKGPTKDKEPKRLWLTFGKGDEALRRRYMAMLEATGNMGDAVMLKQGLIRLLNDFQTTGELSFKRLEEAGS